MANLANVVRLLILLSFLVVVSAGSRESNSINNNNDPDQQQGGKRRSALLSGEDEDDGEAPSSFVRFLQRSDSSQSERGRTVLTFMYLSVLGMCFMTPVLYYFRLHCEERAVRRRLRDMEEQQQQGRQRQQQQQQQRRSNNQDTNDATAAAVAAAWANLESPFFRSPQLHDNNNSNNNTEESRAARRKYIAERRARMLQLFAPVRMILLPEHFPKTIPNEPRSESPVFKKATAGTEKVGETKLEDNDEDPEQPKMNNTSSTDKDDDDEGEEEEEEDEYNLMVEIPVPGLPQHGNACWTAATLSNTTTATRLASGICSICLSAYNVGSDVVWSSNAACDHVFHEACIEKWLMKQREGPLCPCCRRDFIVDPYDIEDEEEGDSSNHNNNNHHLDGTSDRVAAMMMALSAAMANEALGMAATMVVDEGNYGANNHNSGGGGSSSNIEPNVPNDNYNNGENN